MSKKIDLIKLYIIFALALFCTLSLHAQEEISPDSGSDSLYEKEIQKGPKTNLLQNELNGTENKSDDAGTSQEKLNKISQLGNLAPFSDIAVIQKKFLPKTGRFELFPNIGLVTNNAFFFSAFFQGRLGYGITEKWSLEATASFFTNSKSKVTKELKDKKQVDTESHILTRNYYGLDVKWAPIYGKMGVFSSGIMPFDMYFSLGGGIMKTNQDTSPFAIHVGTGQIFALRKWWAFRWDLSGYFYSSDTHVSNSGSTRVNHESFQDIQLSLGMSFFFPDAKYR